MDKNKKIKVWLTLIISYYIYDWFYVLYKIIKMLTMTTRPPHDIAIAIIGVAYLFVEAVS